MFKWKKSYLLTSVYIIIILVFRVLGDRDPESPKPPGQNGVPGRPDPDICPNIPNPRLFSSANLGTPAIPWQKVTFWGVLFGGSFLGPFLDLFPGGLLIKD